MTYNEELKNYNAIKKIGNKIKILEGLKENENNETVFKLIENLIYEYESEQDRISDRG